MSTFDNDLINANKLLDTLGAGHPKYLDAHTLLKRLEENISKAELYGDTSDLASSRAVIRRELDKISLGIYGRTIDKLSGGTPQTRTGIDNFPHPQSETPGRISDDDKLGSESMPKSTPSKGNGCSTLFQIIVGISTIVACVAAILVVPPVNRAIEAMLYSSTQTPSPTETPIPTATDYTWDDPVLSDTPADSILDAEQIWYGNGLELRLRKPMIYMCENVVLAFELSISNTSGVYQFASFNGVDIVITDQNGEYYTNVLYGGGGIRNDCYANSRLDLLSISGFPSGARYDFTFYVYHTPQLQNGDYFLATILKVGAIQNARWKIPAR